MLKDAVIAVDEPDRTVPYCRFRLRRNDGPCLVIQQPSAVESVQQGTVAVGDQEVDRPFTGSVVPGISGNGIVPPTVISLLQQDRSVPRRCFAKL